MTFHLQFDLTNRLNTSNLMLKIIDVIWPESPDYYLPKGLIRIIMSLSMKTFYYQTIDSDMKQYEEIRKIKTRQGEGYTIGCLLDYGLHNYRLTVVDLSRQHNLDVDPKTIQHIELVGQLKNIDKVNSDGTIHVCFNDFRKKIKETRLEFSQGSVTVL